MSVQSIVENSQRAAVAAWSRRVRRVGGLIQLAFAAFWLIRGSLVVGGLPGGVLAAASTVVAGTAAGYGLRVTAGRAPRPRGPDAAGLERAITIATIVQLLASFAVPAAVLAIDRPLWVLPSIAITIGPLLLWLDRRVSVPRYRLAGWALIVGPVLLVLAVPGTAVAASTGLGCGVLLLVTAIAGFRDLGDSSRF